MDKRKHKYNLRLDPDNLGFVEIKPKINEVLFKRVLPRFITSLLFGIFIFILVSPHIISPAEKRQKEKIENLRYQYKLLNKDLEATSLILDELQKRDDNLYRMIYGMPPLPESKRLGGIGGSEKYNELKNFSFGENILEIKSKAERNMKRMLGQSASYKELLKLVKDKENMVAHIPAIQPILPKDLTRFGSPFGMRMHPILGYARMHYGVDLTAPTGTPIYAPGDGVVFRSGWSNGFGKHVRIDHGYGYVTVYGHMSKLKVRPGQKVKRGDIIGEVGSTGLSTSPHLHYEVRVNGQWVNPVNFYYDDLSDDDLDKMINSADANTHVFE